MKVFHKLFNTKASSLDEDKKSVTFVISTNQEDRYGDIVDQKSWDFKAYKKNPLVLWGHDPSQPENVLGTAKDLKISDDGKETLATLTFDTDINPKAGLVFSQIARGTLRTVSVGFRNRSLEWDEDTPVLKDNELFEISVVPIPANAGAIAKELKAGELNERDAKYLLTSMRKEADLLDAQLKQSQHKEKSMTEEQATALIDSIAKLNTTVDGLVADNASLKEELAALKPEEKPEEPETTPANPKDPATPEKPEDKAPDAPEQDPAKGGDNDQPGAGDDADDFDEDAELTPEIQAQIDAELETLQPAA